MKTWKRRRATVRVMTAYAALVGWGLLNGFTGGAEPQALSGLRASQSFQQESSRSFAEVPEAPHGKVQLIFSNPDGMVHAFDTKWHLYRDGHWEIEGAIPAGTERQFFVPGFEGGYVEAPVPGSEVRQIIHTGAEIFVVARTSIFVAILKSIQNVAGPAGVTINQLALDAGGQWHIATSGGVFARNQNDWSRVEATDEGGRVWGAKQVLGIQFDLAGRLWFATKAGLASRSETGWKFYEGKDGLPWNDFTGLAAGANGGMWFSTHLGVIRFAGGGWHYRQGMLWLPDDDVNQMAIGKDGAVWLATTSGVGCIEQKPLTLAKKADLYEKEIDQYIKRTPFGFVAEAALGKAADRSSATPQDSDNDGLWTAMYGAGECFGYAATKSPQTRDRARKAFEALRFLQQVTQGGPHAPPKGFVARTIRPIEWPDPNVGRIERDREEKKGDKLWKVFEPRWPKSADGKWFWKSDTSSDELDGHYFFYPLYFDFCADTEPERDRVREVVRDLTDHLVSHDFTLVDHDGKPTRWGVYGPQQLNENPNWWEERGLKSLSMLSYLAVAAHVTGDSKYLQVSRELIDKYGYAQNAMHYKVQHGPGSGNQSDDEMAFMCFYSLLRYSQDEPLKEMIRYSFFRAWANESAELNPFFNLAYAGVNLEAVCSSPWGIFPVRPWFGWFEDTMSTLYGFPLDRLNWGHRNSHRLDIVRLSRVQSEDLSSPEKKPQRGFRVNGKVLPVENRHFDHWNTDPWQLDYSGNGGELAAGTVFLLPYYMGLYHGFIEKSAAPTQ